MNSIQAELRGPVGWLRIARPEAMNSMTEPMLHALQTQVLAWQADPGVRVIVLTGTGNVFCAGADLKAALGQMQESPADGPAGMLAQAGRFCSLLRTCPRPVIAAVNGLAIGGGMELVLACDLVVAAQSARLGDGHANHGVFPAAGGAALLPRKVPLNVAKWLLFTGEAMSAEELCRAGLVNAVVPDAQLETWVQARAEAIAQKSPSAVSRMKQVANESLDKSAEDALRHELVELHAHLRSEDFKEGLRAFAEKRKPRFTPS